MNALILLFRGPNAEWVKAGNLSQSNVVRIATAKRDVGICPITGSRLGEKCHILPFWTLNRPCCPDVLDAAVPVYGLARIQILHEKLVDTQNIDSSLHMITLNPVLVKLWDRGIFGLEPVALLYEEDKMENPDIACPSTVELPQDIKPTEEAEKPARTPIGIRIRFYWLPKTMGLTPDTLPKNMIELWRTWSQ
ncbi:hypothetical protein CSAL01_07446 [Colletotrichum salicis]|uniref:Uncharacterized protein n=1 Tax=Colletotrichum salicis TaxID=1209931 RepID=A0A135U6P0_9PEZI|nr:hypothetical protein CSAL01_07446 [Colletotrichum salicis]